MHTRVRALVNLSAIGITGTSRGGELSHLPYADPEGCARTIIDNPDLAFGVKLRFGPGLVWEYSAEPVKLARKAADMAGGVPMMMHITNSPVPLPDADRAYEAGRHRHALLSRPRARHHGPGEGVRAERDGRGAAPGIIFDCAHGRNHFNFRMTQRALDQGFMTDTISTDLTFTTATQRAGLGPAHDDDQAAAFRHAAGRSGAARDGGAGEDHGL